MYPVFAKQSDENKLTPSKGQTLGEFLDEHELTNKLNEVALYNWGTMDAREINRALVELVGCAEVKDDPLQSVLDPDLGVTRTLYKPVPWTPGVALASDKVHTVKVRKRHPVPAISITKLTRWFKPGTDTCEVEYQLEGVSARASKVDFEVHATRYYDLRLSNPVVMGEPLEWVEVPSYTQDEAGTTHLFQCQKFLEVAGERPPSVAQKAPTWKGESDVKKGVLKKVGMADVYIHSGCAPYNVLLRYYKDDQDNKAKLLLDPFFPRWKPIKGAPPELDDTSLVITWKLQDDKGKLKRGQLIIQDKNDHIVFFAPLDENTLRTEKYDLVNDARKKWNKAHIKRDAMPYRVQLQAHSDENEEAGLALAVMPTEVPALQYDKVQFIAFNVKPGTDATPNYLGDPDPMTDITFRCDAMKEAIRLAYQDPNVNTGPNVLKLFMAPEFYFRGQKGGYPVKNLPDIIRLMREETDKFKYADWLFVFGTAIGYLEHEDKHTPSMVTPIKHGGDAKLNVELIAVDQTNPPIVTKLTVKSPRKPATTEKVSQGLNMAEIGNVTQQRDGNYLLTLKTNTAFVPGVAVLVEPVALIADVDNSGPATKLRVLSRVCSRIHPTAVASPARWKVKASGQEDEIVTCHLVSPGEYWLTLANKKAFSLGEAELIEPRTTEVFNVALVQKGWPALFPSKGGLKQAAIYKEAISWIDFLGPNMGKNDWFLPDGSGRLIDIHGEKGRVVLPTDGADELLGTQPNKPGSGYSWTNRETGETHTVGSEINKTGIGG
ncbi:MAG TPA: hypothetical protein VEU33_28085, partial [Archangium sp.]|nr:hypothetical protein [Archangium sp.]